MKKGSLLLLLALALPLAGGAQAATSASLSAGYVTGHPGTMGLALPIDLSAGGDASVAALNFDLHFDGGKVSVSEVAPGEAALAAEKEIAFSEPSAGTLRVVIYGLNQTSIGDGIVAQVVFDVAPDAPQGQVILTFDQVTAASPEAERVPITTTAGSIEITGTPTTFADVPRSHWAYGYIEALYQAGYTKGCAVDPPQYCPDRVMDRAEGSVFTVRAEHGSDFEPPDPVEQVFADVSLADWPVEWITQLFEDGYTAGCGTDPLIFCPWRAYNRAEGSVFALRIKHGKDFVPPAPQGIFEDMTLEQWGTKWAEAAYAEGLIPACQENPLRFCPEGPLDRAMSAYMICSAKGLEPVEP